MKTCSSSWEERVGKMTAEEELGHHTAEEPNRIQCDADRGPLRDLPFAGLWRYVVPALRNSV